MKKLFLAILVLFLFNGCVMKEEYYSNKKPTVVQSTYNMKNRCHNCTKYIESSENQKSVIYLEDDIIYMEETVTYDESPTTVVYIDEDNTQNSNEYEEVYYINEKSEEIKPTYSEEVIYYYEEEL